MTVTYQVNWLDQLKRIADRCDLRPNSVTAKDLKDSVIYIYEILAELKEAEEMMR